MGTIKSCRDPTRIQKQIPKQIPQIPKQIQKQNPKQKPKINFKKKVPVEVTERPPFPVCWGYKPKEEKDECGICKRCFYNQKVLIQYFSDNNFKTVSKYSCDAKTQFNKQNQTKSFRKIQKKVLNQRIDDIVKSLKNL